MSILMPPTVAAEAELPALSTQLPLLVTDWLAPSPLRVPPTTESIATPDWTEPVSAQLKKTGTAVLFQPLAFASGSRLPLITGDVLSILMPPTVAGEAVLPALSTQAPPFVTDWSAPSLVSVAPATVSVAMSDWTEPASAQLKETVTSVLFQPLAFASGLRLPLITGAVLSTLMPLTVAGEAALPALSTQSPLLVTDWPAPSELTVAPATVSLAMPDCTPPVSAQLKETTTSLLFQPLALARGLRLPLITGAVLSMLMPLTVAVEAALPALSTQSPLFV